MHLLSDHSLVKGMRTGWESYTNSPSFRLHGTPQRLVPLLIGSKGAHGEFQGPIGVPTRSAKVKPYCIHHLAINMPHSCSWKENQDVPMKDAWGGSNQHDTIAWLPDVTY